MQNGGGFRGPPLPLVIVPIVYQIVRVSPDLKIAGYVKNLVKRGGSASVAENAHHIMQYALSRVPSNLIYWFASKVLNLQPEVAMQITEFLKSKTQLEALPEQATLVEAEAGTCSALTIPSDVERRLEKLEMEYRMLQEKHNESLKRLAYYGADNVDIPRELVLPTPPQSPEAHVQTSTELVTVVTVPTVGLRPTDYFRGFASESPVYRLLSFSLA